MDTAKEGRERRNFMSRREIRREAKLQTLRKLGPLLAASLVPRRTRCGNPQCRCARGELHQQWCVTFKVKAKTHTVHVPKDMVEEVREWIKEHQRLRQLVREISRLNLAILRSYVPGQRAAARARGKSASPSRP